MTNTTKPVTVTATAIAVRERPLIMSGPMVVATLAGRKSQTRRVLTDRNTLGNVTPSQCLLSSAWVDPGPSPAGNVGPYLKAPVLRDRRGRDITEQEIIERIYPRYAVGDRLWVRETFFDYGNDPIFPGELERLDRIEYRATPWDHEFADPEDCGPWTSPIHMPRWASRLTLEITEVRVGRLQEISGPDVVAEGVEWESNWGHSSAEDWDAFVEEEERLAVAAFAKVWDSLNAKRNGGAYSWESNPWCWCISFQRVTA